MHGIGLSQGCFRQCGTGPVVNLLPNSKLPLACTVAQATRAVIALHSKFTGWLDKVVSLSIEKSITMECKSVDQDITSATY